ncbi:hypothetical protein C8F04DRAFT_1269103 [Mycena alexandri]|uniref:Uncharacterized protein n=1 Tax=Mycena alexandri TaxID=1745969 RepID=A0AAD6WUP3_9AGAR|nr:hypothetical protein C8F04DRAFT_1269103 [Mycena alexandri]
MAEISRTTTPPGSPPTRCSVPPIGDGAPLLDQVPLDLENLLPMPPAVVTSQKGTVPRPRRKKGEDKEARGKESWVHGTKLKFFEARKSEYLVAAEKGANGDKAAPGAFYTKMARLYIIKYGYNLKDNEDLAVDVADPPDEAANTVVNKKSSADSEKEAQYHKTMRGRIGEWYRRKYGGLLKTDKAAFQELFTGVFDGAPAKPQRGQLLHCYSRHFFEARVKERFDARYESLKRRAEFTEEAVPKSIVVQNQVTKEVWEEETPAFREDVRALWEREYQQALKGWKASLADSPTRTPEELAASLENAAYYLQPFVDAISERFGMVASLLLCGPIGRNQGVVGMQSVHAGETRGIAPMKWPQWNKARFQEVESRMIEFGRECFSEEQCRARAVGVPVAHFDKDTSPPAAGTRTSSAPGTAGPGTSASHVAGTSSRGTSSGAGGDGAAVGEGGDDDGAGGDGATAGGGGADDDSTGNGAGAGSSGGGGAGSGGGAGGAGGDGGGEGNEDNILERAMRNRIDRLWARTDRAEWTSELVRAHAAFARGREWGIEWARCVSAFFDFESAHGYNDGSEQMPTEGRPKAFLEWLIRGREWDRFGMVGSMPIGTQNEEGSWVAGWWAYWVSLQPAERVYTGGVLSRPQKVDWSGLAQLNGKNGLLQVMALLLWWGDYVGDGEDVFQYVDWKRAVEEVTWVLRELETSGLISGEVVGLKRKRARTKAAKAAEAAEAAEAAGEPASKVLRRSARHDHADEGRQTRSRQKAATPGEKEKDGKGKGAKRDTDPTPTSASDEDDEQK